MKAQNQNTISKLDSACGIPNVFDLRFLLLAQAHAQALQTQTTSDNDSLITPAFAASAIAVVDADADADEAPLASESSSSLILAPLAPASPAPVPASPVPAPASPAPVPSSPDIDLLLSGFSHFIHFLLEAEADYLCGVPLCTRGSPKRTNYRMGYFKRRLGTPLGTILLRIPHLLYFHPRVAIAKRAKRLSPEILASLCRVHAAGVTRDEAALLVKTLWTIELSGGLHAALTEKLITILEQWRAAPVAGQSGPRADARKPQARAPRTESAPAPFPADCTDKTDEPRALALPESTPAQSV